MDGMARKSYIIHASLVEPGDIGLQTAWTIFNYWEGMPYQIKSDGAIQCKNRDQPGPHSIAKASTRLVAGKADLAIRLPGVFRSVTVRTVGWCLD